MDENRICSQCNASLPPDVRFCTMCGHSLDATPTAVPAPDATKKPSSQSAGRVIGVLLLLITLIAGGGFFRYRDALAQFLHLRTAINNTVRSEPQRANTETPASPTVNDPAESEENQLDGPVITAEEPAFYMPMPYRSYRYYEWYPDGDKGEWTQITASLREPIPISSIEVLDDPPNYIRAAYHYLQKGADIYQIEDSQPHQAELILSTPIKVGALIKSNGVTGTITKLKAKCTTGGRSYTGCLVISRNYTAADYRVIEYWAPGNGLVLVEAPDGTPVRKLLQVKDIDVQQAVDRVAKATPNIEKVHVP